MRSWAAAWTVCLPALAWGQASLAPPPADPPLLIAPPSPPEIAPSAPPPLLPLPDGGLTSAPLAPPNDVPVLSGWPDGGLCESLEAPDELYGKVHLERAIRAELEGRLDEAHAEAQAAQAASPQGRYAVAARVLDVRVLAAGADRGSGPARAELAIAGTMEGITAGALFAAGVGADSKGSAGLVMAGSATGLGVPLFLTSRFRVRQTVPVMFEAGGTFGLTVVLLGESIGDGRDVSVPAALGLVGGSLTGVLFGESLHLSLGDAGGAFSGLLLAGGGAALAGAAAGASNNTLDGVVLAGAAVGIIGGPILNQALHWSRGRWVLVMLGGTVGVVFGGGLAVLAGVTDGQVGTAAAFAGLAVGVGVTAAFTGGMNADETAPPEGTALLRVAPDGRMGLGMPAPRLLVSEERHLGVGVDVLGGRF